MRSPLQRGILSRRLRTTKIIRGVQTCWCAHPVDMPVLYEYSVPVCVFINQFINTVREQQRAPKTTAGLGQQVQRVLDPKIPCTDSPCKPRVPVPTWAKCQELAKSLNKLRLRRLVLHAVTRNDSSQVRRQDRRILLLVLDLLFFGVLLVAIPELYYQYIIVQKCAHKQV